VDVTFGGRCKRHVALEGGEEEAAIMEAAYFRHCCSRRQEAPPDSICIFYHWRTIFYYGQRL